MKTLNAFSPLDGTLLKEYPIASIGEMEAALLRAKETFRIFSETDTGKRIRLLKSLRSVIIAETDNIVATICKTTGKVKSEALMTEVFPVLATLKYYEKHLKKFLKPRKVPVPFAFMGIKAGVSLRPSGIALIISPWNFPFQLAMIPIISAIAAGNSVLLKPSEYALPVGELIANLCQSAGFPSFLVQTIYGDGNTGAELIALHPDRILFTGSTKVGKKIMQQAAELTIPVLLELGGKSPMIVFADADFDRAVNGMVFSAFCNSGQVCVATSRAYVEESIYERFTAAVAEKTKQLTQGKITEDDLGFLVLPSRAEALNGLIKEAVSKGAKVLCGSLSGKYFTPVVLANVNEHMAVMKEEIFGPVLPIMSFGSAAEAVRLANDSPYGLSASVWTSDKKKAKDIASKLQAGNININDALISVGIPSLPFGGTKESGIGRYHGFSGIEFFSDIVSIAQSSGRHPSSTAWFPYGAKLYPDFKQTLRLLYGRGHFFKALRSAFRLWLRNFRR